MHSLLKFILYPFSILYGIITRVRNNLYDKGLLKSTRFSIPVIGVGNLAVGGTGKTPMVEYLLKLLGNEKKLATLSRGYGRKTRGFRIATAEDTAETIGDEPLQLFNKYNNQVIVSVGEERILAIPQLLYNHPQVQTIILDDAFQHRSLKPSFQILLTEFRKPYYEDMLMPAGRLRESISGAMRADIVVVTKCPGDISQSAMNDIRGQVKKTAGDKPVFFTTLDYEEPERIKGEENQSIKDVVLVSGIANSQLLEQKIKKTFNLKKHFNFSDHYHYKKKDIYGINKFISGNCPGAVVVTTEKDAVKLNRFIENLDFPLYTLPVNVSFLNDGSIFDSLVQEAANNEED